MTTDWSTLQHTNPQTLKESADLVAVADALGIEMDPSIDGSKWSGLCPFHDDETPSLDVFVGEDGVQRVGCFPCGWTGDVFDLIGRVRDVRFADAVAILATMVADGTVDAPPEVAPDDRPPLDLDAYASTAQAAGTAGLLSLLHERGIEVPPSWLTVEFRVGSNEYGEVVIPHYEADGSKVTAIKVRGPGADGWTKRNLRGSRLDSLYGSWRDHGHDRAVLVEGESDAWTIAYLLRHEPVDVFGLPAGVTATPRAEWIERLRGRAVTLLFDADEAGRRGLQIWGAELVNVASTVLIATLPEGEDATSAGVQETGEALREAASLASVGSRIRKTATGFERDGANAPIQVSDWTIEVTKRIVLENEIVFEVQFPSGKTATLRSADFESTSRMTKWANSLGLAWLGKGSDAQELLRYCTTESLFAPRIYGTSVAGLHEGSFILPDPAENIGAKSWTYVPPVADVHLGERLRIERGAWVPAIPQMLAELHSPAVVTPILGWTAAAPLRSVLPNFPVLAVVGGSGWGKTTLVSEILGTFGFATSPMTMTATTPHAIASLVASTNAIPVWIDEYRPGARQDTKDRLDQAIRDAWDGASSVKGGLQSNLQALTFLPAIAPIVVTGEDAFTETSHAERMVIVPIPMEGKNPEALAALRSVERTGFGYAYLSWIAESFRAGTIPAAPTEPERMAQSRALAVWGWALLEQFTRETCGYEIDVPYDGSRVEAEHAEMSARPPILEALGLMIGRVGVDGRLVAWIDGEDVCLRQQDFYALYRKQFPEAALPGGSRAVANWLAERFRSSYDRSAGEGRFLRLAGAVTEIT